MNITHTVLPTGHFVNIKTERRELSVLTDNGTPEELEKQAADMFARAAGIVDRAEFIKAAACQMRIANEVIK